MDLVGRSTPSVVQWVSPLSALEDFSISVFLFLNDSVDVCAALEGQRPVPRRRAVSRGLHPSAHAVQRGELQTHRRLQPRLRLRRHHGRVRLLQRVFCDALHGLRSTVSRRHAVFSFT